MCECGFSTSLRPNWSTHQKRCKRVTQASSQDQLLAEKDARINSLESQLAEKDKQISEQAKSIADLIKKPRTVTNNNTTHNRYVVEQNVNVFGSETRDEEPFHLTRQEALGLMSDPFHAVSKMVKLKGEVTKNSPKLEVTS